MPVGEPGGTDTEMFYMFDTPHDPAFGKDCHPNCDCGKFMEIGNSVFMQYLKKDDTTFGQLPKKNVDFGGGLERFLAASQNLQDVFKTNLFYPIIQTIEKYTEKEYETHARHMRIITDHFISALFIAANNVLPSNKEQGYVLRRLIRRGFDHLNELKATDVTPILESIVEQYKDTDPQLFEKYEQIKLTVLQEGQKYKQTLDSAKKLIEKELKTIGVKQGDELMGIVEIPAEVAFKSLSSFGLSPTQLKSLGYSFDEQALAEKIKEHQNVSRKGVEKSFMEDSPIRKKKQLWATQQHI
jgi:alanyl-tRNA synthetase